MDDLPAEARGLLLFRARALLQPIFAALLEGLGDLQQAPLLGGGALALVALALCFAPRAAAEKRRLLEITEAFEQRRKDRLEQRTRAKAEKAARFGREVVHSGTSV